MAATGKAPWTTYAVALLALGASTATSMAVQVRERRGTGQHNATLASTLTQEATYVCSQIGDENDANTWDSTKCKSIPDGTDHLRIDMGFVTDYFKPAGTYTLCDMLQSHSKHLWSNDQVTWMQPDYNSDHLGGSAWGWPRNNVAGDERSYLSIWGDRTIDPRPHCNGGCCVSNYVDHSAHWGNAYTMYACAPSAPTASASGDPHLQNVHGERFDLMQEGKHVLINIPRGEGAEHALLRVQADARREGGHCADLYFQELNITGSLAEAKHTGGYHYDASHIAAKTPEWVAFGKVELKVVHGRTDSGLRYLNVFAKHLGLEGFAVGGLLGEDDHEGVSTAGAECKHVVNLHHIREHMHGRVSSAASF